jgi:hypothetical protein
MLFSSASVPDVGLLKSLLDEAGIASEIRNESIYPNFPGAAFQPEIWILDDKDYTAACGVRDGWRQSLPAETSQAPDETSQPNRSDLAFSALTCFLMLASALACTIRFALVGDWRRTVGALLLFGVPGTALAFRALRYYGISKKSDSRRLSSGCPQLLRGMDCLDNSNETQKGHVRLDTR